MSAGPRISPAPARKRAAVTLSTLGERKALGGCLRKNGVYAMVINNSVHTNPPLCITEEQLAEGFGIIDEALALADEGVRSA